MRRERGFILATTLLVMTLLTVMLTAAFVMVSAEYRSTNGSYSATRALNLAHAGMQSYLSQAHMLGSGYDSTVYPFADGYARVVARRLRDSTSSTRAVWIVYSTGVDSTRALTTQGTGSRVVSQLAYLDPGTLPARAALVAANGVEMTTAGSNPIDGTNPRFVTGNCVIPSSPADDTVGLAIGGSGDYTATAVPGNGLTPYPTGEGTNGMELLGNSMTVVDSTYIDWPALVAGQFTPDYYGSLPAAGNNTYQTHYYTGSVTIPSGQRRGMLVTLGDVTLANNSHWDGIIVAGGRLIATPANYTVHGMVITGLNLSRGITVGRNQIRRGSNKVIRWDYCYTVASVNSLAFLVPLSGTYMDVWKTY